MPQFNMIDGHRPEFRALDTFTQGYIEALFWTSSEHGTTRDEWNPETDSSLPGDVGFSDLAPETLNKLIEDCRDFQAGAAELLELAYSGDSPCYGEKNAGIDFWLTRNGHGAGFWDRGLGKVGDELSRQAKPYGGTDAYLGDDGKVYTQ